MKMIFIPFCAALVTSAFFSSFSVAEEAKNLDQLLQMIERSKRTETADYKARQAEFNASKNQQARLLKQAQATRLREEQRSDRLEQSIRDNEQLIAGLRKQLDKRLGSLKELFGHLTGAAGDIRESLTQSIVSAQIPGRTEFLNELIDKMSSDTRLPSIEDIEQLWFEQQREMVESGRIVKFQRSVTLASGDQQEMEVVRVGTYNLLADGMYLEFSPQTGSVSELPRQPASGHQNSAADLQSAASGFTKVGLDPTGPLGGGLLRALINTPTLKERWEFGGIVGLVITAVFAVAIILALWRFVVLMMMSSGVNAQLKSTVPNPKNPLGRVLQVAANNPKLDPESLELKLHEAVLKERPGIESGLNLLKIIAMVAPLLGLLGTVTGMIITFQMITLFGAGDPKTMAGGISQALVTTVLGLVVAIPTVLMHTLVNGKAQRILHVLEEQSAGIVADSVEVR